MAAIAPDPWEMKGEFRVEGNGQGWARPVVTGGRLSLWYDCNLYGSGVQAD